MDVRKNKKLKELIGDQVIAQLYESMKLGKQVNRLTLPKNLAEKLKTSLNESFPKAKNPLSESLKKEGNGPKDTTISSAVLNLDSFVQIPVIEDSDSSSDDLGRGNSSGLSDDDMNLLFGRTGTI